MTDEERYDAGIAYRRTGLSWLECARRVGMDKDRLRKYAIAHGVVDGWGEGSMIRHGPAGSPPSARFQTCNRGESKT